MSARAATSVLEKAALAKREAKDRVAHTLADQKRLERAWEKEREEFDKCYNESLSNAIKILGLPRIQGFDTDENRHCYAIWRGDSGLLILQQSVYDFQFGLDVNFWVQPWTCPDPQPTSPFIDWLLHVSKQ